MLITEVPEEFKGLVEDFNVFIKFDRWYLTMHYLIRNRGDYPKKIIDEYGILFNKGNFKVIENNYRYYEISINADYILGNGVGFKPSKYYKVNTKLLSAFKNYWTINEKQYHNLKHFRLLFYVYYGKK